MRRGTRVGQAYVALSVDGTGINEDIADEFDKFDSRGFAERHGQAYRNAFLREMEGLDKSLNEQLVEKVRTGAGRELNSRLARSFDTEDAMALSVRNQVLSAFKRGAFDDLMKRAGREAGDNFGAEMSVAIKNAVLESVEQSMLDAARNGRDLDFVGGVNRSGNTLNLPGSDAQAAVRAAAEAADRVREEQRLRVEAAAERARLEQESLDDYNRRQRERMKLADMEMSETADRIEAIAKLWEQMDEDRAKADRDERQRMVDRAQRLAEIEQRRRDALNEYNRRELADRLKIEREVAAAAKARQDDDRKFLRSQAAARRLLSRVKIDPTIDRAAVQRVAESIQKQLEKRADLKLKLKGDLSARERAEIEAQIRDIDGTIRLNLDEEHLNRQLLAAQARLRGVSGNGRDDTDLGARVGRLLGAGSRNNFLNIIGRSIGGLVTLTTKLGKSVLSLGQNFAKGFKSASDNATFLQKVMAGFGEGGINIGGLFSKLAASGPAAAGAILVVAAAMSVLASVASALVAILTALLATITSALVGGLTVLGGAIAAVTAGIGLLVVAFTSLTDAQKKAMSETFGPLKDLLVGIGQVVLRDLIPAFDQWSVNLRGALRLIVPLAEVMGKAFGAAGSILTKSLSGAGFQNFFGSLTEMLPEITTRLSSALGGFLNGMLGLFSAIMPFVVQFSQYLDRVATRFSNWANSAQGQNAIVDFTERALESLKSLWNFVREFFGFLGDVLFSPEAQQAGNAFFDSLAKSFRGFRDAIARAQADGSLDRWFKSAAKFAGDLKVLLIGLKDVFKTLVSSKTLSTVGDFVRILGKLLSLFTDIEQKAEGAKSGIKGIVEQAGKLVGLKGLGGIVDVASGIANPLKQAGFAMDTLNQVTGQAKGETSKVRLEAFGLADAFDRARIAAGLMVTAFAPAAQAFSGIKNAVSGIVNSISTSIATASAQVLGAASPQGTVKAPYKNPYEAFANSLIKDGPTIAAQIASAVKLINAQIGTALLQATKSKDGAQVRDGLLSMYQTVREQGQQLVDAARQNLNTAASRLASASTPKEAARALAAVRRAQAGLAAAIKSQKNLNRAATLLAQQRLVKTDNVQRLIDGLRTTNVTLAEFATARGILATRIETATERLKEAITIRDNFKTQIADSIKSFGSLVSATAQTINGVAQALTATDVVGNLEDRLAQIRKFQENLRLLLANGLSDEAYKQLLEAGVEGGGATAEALVAGGQSAVEQVNNLIKSIGEEATGLGDAASTRMYQTGVDLAQGLLDGLKSLDAQLAAAATKLGDNIAKAIKNVLGIRSPSRVAYELMGYWGDGLVQGLDAQGVKVSTASARLAGQVAVSPEVAAYASRQSGDPVSGNGGPLFRDFVVQTPTEDPKAVAQEAINELTGRL